MSSPFVFRAPLAKSAPSNVCPSAAKRSFSVSISLRTESQTDRVLKDGQRERQQCRSAEKTKKA